MKNINPNKQKKGENIREQLFKKYVQQTCRQSDWPEGP